MNSFDTLLFPDTNVFIEKFYSLLLFFTPLHFMQVVEHGPGSDTNSDAELFLKRGLCRAHVPAPLGDNREHFLRLIHDVSEKKEYLVAQLSGLTTDSSPAQAGREQLDPKHGIVSSLLQEYGMEHVTTTMDLQLWQARLVLAIAEILDSNQEDLREQLFFFNEDEIAAYRSLQGETDSNEEDLFSELENIKARLEKSRLGGIKKRFDAWVQLLQNQPVPSVKVWLASTRDSADQIFNRYESIGKAHAVPLLKLALPAQIAASGQYMVEQIDAFQLATMPIHRGLVADFERIARTVPYVHDAHKSLLPYGTDWADQWERALDDFFPASSNGRNDITFYLLPDQRIDRLLSLKESSGGAHGDAVHGLLAILDTPQTL
ncbi:hypothetical protein FCL47_12455 [Desulfopila sp. IMCC35006]|uniref:hypothetical protein n=1 Tax=Desulfopila sp. IMCC35006 TaxID=2569542 RepID=UPI0010AC4744|nr:hypothetical protein [Desulfopila sp. IMCC35006]TKB25896.1 hypothetical protein FCL47_12455 [Desulfopila sp. IMCC35006]